MSHNQHYITSPSCEAGFTKADLRAMLGDHYPKFTFWMAGRTCTVCTGRKPCTEAHGIVHAAFDVSMFVSQHGRQAINPPAGSSRSANTTRINPDKADKGE